MRVTRCIHPGARPSILPVPVPNRSRLALLAAGLLLCAHVPARAGGAPPVVNASSPTPAPRDVLRRTIEPVVDAFSRQPDGPNRAFTLHARVAEASAQPPELRGSRLEFICQAPDKVIFQFIALGSVVTISRVDQTFWASPADKLAPLLARVEEKPPTRADKEPIEPLRLTIPTRVFWVLFYLVGVQDAGNAALGAVNCRRLDIHIPESKKGEFARLWVSGAADPGKPPLPVRAEFLSPDSHAALDIEEAQVSVSVPASVFEPDAGQRANLLNVPAERFRPFMTLLGKEEEKRRKQFIRDHPIANP